MDEKQVVDDKERHLVESSFPNIPLPPHKERRRDNDDTMLLEGSPCREP